MNRLPKANALSVGIRQISRLLLMPVLLVFAVPIAKTQETPYFVTDHHHLPEAGTLGMASYNVGGVPKAGNGFIGSILEFEYRPVKWWATEVQLEGQTTFGESTVFTGYTWVNKFKLAPKNRWINSVLTIGWEDSNAASKSIVEIEGHSARDDFAIPNNVARQIREHEIESKLILSRDYRGWNFAGNIIGVKDLSGEPWQFGYSLGTNRAFSTSGEKSLCPLCRKSFAAGLELYGGLGDAHSFGLQDTAHYLGPVLSWQPREGFAIKAGPHFGLTPQSQRALIHFAVIYDIPEFGTRVKQVFGRD